MSHITSTDVPPVAFGHIALTVANLEASHKFYEDVGLRSFMKDDEMGILELRGGTHLLLFRRDGPGQPASGGPLDQKPAERIDLMIAGRTFEDLDAFRSRLVAQGIQASPIPDQRFFGHYAFQATDPDGNQVTISTSHASDLPI
ncbi:MAG: VOC family protein [Caulobacterales bacterium]